MAGGAPGHGRSKDVDCPVCGRPADYVYRAGEAQAREIRTPDTQCPECGWTLESALRAGPVTDSRREDFTLRLRTAQQALDARIVARIAADPGPYLSCIRGGLPDERQWSAARLAVGLETSHAADEAILRSRLEALVSALQADAQAVIVDVGADGIVTTRLGLDRFGSPWLDRTASRQWSDLLPMLSDAEHERYFQLAGGVGRLDRDAIAECLRAATADLPRGNLLIACRPAGWLVPELAAATLTEARPGAQLLRVAGSPGDVPAGTVLASLTTEAPLRDAYELALATVDEASGEVGLLDRQIFAVGDVPGTACRLSLRRPPGDDTDTTVAIFSTGGSRSEPLALYSVPLPRGSVFDLHLTLEAPGRVRIDSPSDARRYTGTWAQVRSEIPDRVDVRPGPADLVCAVDLAGPVQAVRNRLRLVRSLLEQLMEEYDEPGWLRVSMLTCTDHSFERGREYRPVVRGTPLAPISDALAWFSRQERAAVTYAQAAPIEDLLHEASIMLADSRMARRAARLLIVGGRRPHPYPQGSGRIMRCPLKYKWRQSLQRLTGEAGARCVAVADAIPADGTQAALWEELGPAGLHQLTGATAQRVGADLALLVTHAQRIPIPLPDPE